MSAAWPANRLVKRATVAARYPWPMTFVVLVNSSSGLVVFSQETRRAEIRGCQRGNAAVKGDATVDAGGASRRARGYRVFTGAATGRELSLRSRCLQAATTATSENRRCRDRRACSIGAGPPVTTNSVFAR